MFFITFIAVINNKLSGEKTAFEPWQWVDNHGNYLYNYAWARVQSKETTEKREHEEKAGSVTPVVFLRLSFPLISLLLS